MIVKRGEVESGYNGGGRGVEVQRRGGTGPEGRAERKGGGG